MRLVWFGLVVAACSTGSGDERPAAPAGTAGSKSRSPDDKTNSAGETATHEAGAAGSGAADGSGAEGGATPGAGGALAGGTPSAEAGAGIVFEVAGAPEGPRPRADDRSSVDDVLDTTKEAVSCVLSHVGLLSASDLGNDVPHLLAELLRA